MPGCVKCCPLLLLGPACQPLPVLFSLPTHFIYSKSDPSKALTTQTIVLFEFDSYTLSDSPLVGLPSFPLLLFRRHILPDPESYLGRLDQD